MSWPAKERAAELRSAILRAAPGVAAELDELERLAARMELERLDAAMRRPDDAFNDRHPWRLHLQEVVARLWSPT